MITYHTLTAQVIDRKGFAERLIITLNRFLLKENYFEFQNLPNGLPVPVHSQTTKVTFVYVLLLNALELGLKFESCE